MKISQVNQFLPLKNADIGKTAAAQHKTAENEKKLRESAKQLEGLFIGFVLKAMEKTIPRADDQKSNNMVSMMFSSVMGKELAEQGGFGLSDYLYRSMSRKGETPSLEDLKSSLTGDIRFNINMSENNNE
jgi:flagellar protein FlgJ